jgi:CheY-like chemotaxis protein
VTSFYFDSAVLVVDDDPGQLLIVKSLLENAGYRVLTAASGLHALEVMHDLNEPLLVLVTDVEMPDMNGRVLADELRKTQRDLRVLYLTGHSDQLFAKGALLGDRDAFLEKPVSSAALTEAVRLLLRRTPAT